MGIPPFRHSCSFKCVTLIFSFQRAAAVPPAVAADPAADDRHGPHRHLEAHRPGRHLQFQGLQDRPQRPPVRSQLGMLIVNRPIQLFEILSQQWIHRLRGGKGYNWFFSEKTGKYSRNFNIGYYKIFVSIFAVFSSDKISFNTPNYSENFETFNTMTAQNCLFVGSESEMN